MQKSAYCRIILSSNSNIMQWELGSQNVNIPGKEIPGKRNVDDRLLVKWIKVKVAAQDRDRAGWRQVVCGVCFTGSDKA